MISYLWVGKEVKKIRYYLGNTSKKGPKLGKKSDMSRRVGQKWPQKIGYHM